MIDKVGNKKLLYKTPLIEYIKKEFNYENEKLFYDNKYSEGSFSVSKPSEKYKNCAFINGYPHFDIPLDICIQEITFFMEKQSMYDNSICIRYGDTHPNKPIPKLGQFRNIFIGNCISSMIGKNAKNIFCIGDISIKSLKDFILKNSLSITEEELFIKLLNNNLDNNTRNLILGNNIEISKKIIKIFQKMSMINPEFLFESDLYANHDLYEYIKNNPEYKMYLKPNGEIKYTLQELMFIKSIIKDNSTLINIIGNDQSEHIKKVIRLLENDFASIDCRFLSYGICKNAMETDVDKWTNKLNEYIQKNNININNKLICVDEMLNILFIVCGIDNIIDFNNIDKYLIQIKKFCSYLSQIKVSDKDRDTILYSQLLAKMALVGYTLNSAIELGNPFTFYKYVTEIIIEHNKNREKYLDINDIYNKFIICCFERLGFQKEKLLERKLIL